MVTRLLFGASIVRCALAATASHRFGPRHAEVFWHPGTVASHSNDGVLRTDNQGTKVTRMLQRSASARHQVPDALRIMHITDAHISIKDDMPPFTSRMYNAFHQTRDHVTEDDTEPSKEFTKLLHLAKAEKVDLIALGGDIVNAPSADEVGFVLQQLREVGIPFVYTAGNHDWHIEGHPEDVKYDSARVHQINTTLLPLFEQSSTWVGDTHGVQGKLFGHQRVKGVDVMFVDNSNFQITGEQLAFVQEKLVNTGNGLPAILLMHMPLALPGVELAPKDVCGHPQWGAQSDSLSMTEGRPPWPEEGNSPDTKAFIRLIQAQAAPHGRLVAVLTGHVHRDFSAGFQDSTSAPARPASNLTTLACDQAHPQCKLDASTVSSEGVDPEDRERYDAQASGALQYTTLDAAEGGFRLLTIRHRRAF